ncbi:hypothetical protein Tco_0776170 [Tanacetum coccineum]
MWGRQSTTLPFKSGKLEKQRVVGQRGEGRLRSARGDLKCDSESVYLGELARILANVLRVDSPETIKSRNGRLLIGKATNDVSIQILCERFVLKMRYVLECVVNVPSTDCELKCGSTVKRSSINVMVSKPSPSLSGPRWAACNLVLNIVFFQFPANCVPTKPVPGGTPLANVHLSNMLSFAPVLEIFVEAYDRDWFDIVQFLTELVKLTRRT